MQKSTSGAVVPYVPPDLAILWELRRSKKHFCISRFFSGVQCKKGCTTCHVLFLDHEETWCQGREPVCITGHLYDLCGYKEKLEWATSQGGYVRVHPNSWYYPGRTLCVEMWRSWDGFKQTARTFLAEPRRKLPPEHAHMEYVYTVRRGGNF
jgi:hypothetical protein